MADSSQIPQILTDTLSADTNARIAAELKLAEILPRQGSSLSSSLFVRKASGTDSQHAFRSCFGPFRNDAHTWCQFGIATDNIILRKYIVEHWSPYFQSFKGSAPSLEVKAHIRQAVFTGLSDPERKIRSLCAHTLSSIASCDWPDDYPDLLSSLIALVSSNNTNSVHGAMQVFSEFIKSELTEDQILPVLRQLLPVLLSILGAPEQHSPLTRARTVAVFRQCIRSLHMVKDQHPQAVKEAVTSVLPTWLEAFRALMNSNPQNELANEQNWEGLAIRIQIVTTLDEIQMSFPRVLAPYLQDFLSACLFHLQVLSPFYSKYNLLASGTVPHNSEDNPIEIAHLLCPILDFMSEVVRTMKVKEWLVGDNFDVLVERALYYIQMTQENEDTWANDANAFVAQEIDESMAFNVRGACFDLLTALISRSLAQSCAAFDASIRSTVASSQASKQQNLSDWWKPLEALLAALGSQSSSILHFLDEWDSKGPMPVDVGFLLSEVIPSLLTLSDCSFLQGRGFVFASQFARYLPPALFNQYLEAAMQVLESHTASVPVKVSSVKAVQNFSQRLDDELTLPFASRITRNIGPLLLLTTEDTLSLILETLSSVLRLDHGSWLTEDLSTAVVRAILEVWPKNNKDPIILNLLTEIFTSLAQAEAVYENVVHEALPNLCGTIGSAKPQESWFASAAIDMVTGLVDGAPSKGLGEGFFSLLAPSLFSCLQIQDDRDVLENGGACLKSIVRKDCRQLLSWRDSTGQSGLDYVFKVIAKLLQVGDQSGGMAVGDLIIDLLSQAGETISPVFPDLFRAMLGCMANAKTATFTQSLVIPFAYLIHNQMDAVLSLLESTTIDGRNGLDILIQTWCENAETFQGYSATKRSIVALSQLYASDRPSLQALMVKGDMIVKPETANVIMTRSRTKQIPHEFTAIPFPVKALKILVHELSSRDDSGKLNSNGETIDIDELIDAESDDENEDWSDEEDLRQGLKNDEFAFLSDMIGPAGLNLDENGFDQMDDAELREDDPLSNIIRIQDYLIPFLNEYAARNRERFVEHIHQLSAAEMSIVQRIIQ